MEWAQRLRIDLNQPRVVAVVEVDSGQLGVDSAMSELQQLQTLGFAQRQQFRQAPTYPRRLVQLRRASGGVQEPQIRRSRLTIDGWSIENRVYAEDPYRGFLPSTGRLTRYRPPEALFHQAPFASSEVERPRGGVSTSLDTNGGG